MGQQNLLDSGMLCLARPERSNTQHQYVTLHVLCCMTATCQTAELQLLLQVIKDTLHPDQTVFK